MRWLLLVHGTAPVIAAHRRHRPRQEMIEEILGVHSITDPSGCLFAREHLWGGPDVSVVTWSDRVVVPTRRIQVISAETARGKQQPDEGVPASWPCPPAWLGSASPGPGTQPARTSTSTSPTCRPAGPLCYCAPAGWQRLRVPRGGGASRSRCAAGGSGVHRLASRRGSASSVTAGVPAQYLADRFMALFALMGSSAQTLQVLDHAVREHREVWN
jgi:hypothetical protein